MNVAFNFLGLSCIAFGDMENGHFVADEISAAGSINSDLLPSKLFDALCSKMDCAAQDVAASYKDETSYFGEDVR